ncbi:MAG: Ig-like domain-containing protein, partial [Clostridia bacterium]|nr:Ig-like domain-containing protein [Clostridia bacterium]
MTKGKTRKILGLSFMAVFVLACAVGLGACANKHEVKNISISDKTLDLTVGDETELTVGVTMKDDTEYDGMYYWSATQDGIVEISADTARTSDATVTVKAVAEGNTTVYVEAGGYKKHCDITVGPAPEKPIVTDVKLSETSLTLKAGGDGKELSAFVTMSDDSEYDGEYEWSAAPEGYVSISGTGGTVTVTGEKAGNVLITFNAGGKEATCAVTVEPAYEESGYSEEVYVDFSDSDTYEWIDMISVTYTKSSDGSVTTYDNAVKGESEADTSPEGLLTIV